MFLFYMVCIALLAEIASRTLSGKQVITNVMNQEQSRADGSLTKQQKRLPLGMAHLDGGCR